MAISPIKYRKLLEEIARDPSLPVYVVAMRAGFTETTARKQGKRLLDSAIAWQATESKRKTQPAYHTEREQGEIVKENIKEKKQRIYERLGMSSEQLLNNVKHLAEQTKDYGVRLKVVRTLVRDMDDPIELDPDVPNSVMPVLNITVREKLPVQAQYQQLDNGLVERLPETTSQKIDSAT